MSAQRETRTILRPINYVPAAIWKHADFFEVFPLDGGGYFSFVDVVGATDDKTATAAVATGKLFDPIRLPNSRIDWERYDWLDTAERGAWFNRWYYLASAARTYWLTGNEKISRAVRDVIVDWISSQTPPPDYPKYLRQYQAMFDSGERREHRRTGDVWCDFQLAERVLVGYWIACFLKKSSQWDQRAWSDLGRSMAVHARLLHWTDRDGKLEPGNHQMLRGYALLHAAAMLPEAKERDAWWKLGARLMTLHAASDFTSEGVGREGSFSYQLFSLSLIAHATALAQAMRRPAPRRWQALVAKMSRFLTATATPALTTPLVNDGYEAQIGPLLNICRRLLPQLTQVSRRGARCRAVSLTKFPVAKVAVLDARCDKGEPWMLAECLPPFGHSGHWHAGKPTLHLWLGGHMLLGDAGCPNYDDKLYSTWFRRGPAHFTVTVDGHEDAEYVSDVRWAQPPRLRIAGSRMTQGRAVLDFENSGFRRLKDPVSYSRRVEYRLGEGLLVRDRLLSRKGVPHTFRLHVPFMTQSVKRDGCNALRVQAGRHKARVSWELTRGVPRVTLTRKPVSIGLLRGDYPYLQIEVRGVPETEFRLAIRPAE